MILEFPIYRQLDAKDCGPSCLRMIAKFYGRVYSIQNLREKAFITREGVSMLGISEAAEAIGFRTQGVRITVEELEKECPLPCILHWNQWHFVVCYKIKKGKFYIADPAAGLITYTREEFKRCWVSTKVDGQDTGTALLLEPGPEFYGMEDEGRDRLQNLRFQKISQNCKSLIITHHPRCRVNLNLSKDLLPFQFLGVYLGVEFQTHPIMNIKRNIIFALESRKKNGVPIVENVPIRMRVIYASQRIEFTTGYRIDVAKWDADKQRVKNGCTNKLKQSASEINADLLKYYAEMQNVFKEFEVQETMPTTQQLKDAFNLRMKDSSEEQQEEAQISFWEVFDEFVKECGNQNNWTASTYEKFAAVRNHIKEFKEDVTFEYFNEFGLNEYVNFLRDKKDMRNSTIGKQMGFLKWFLRWSFKKGHHQNIAYDAFKPKLKTTPKKVIFLTWDELNKLKDYHIPHDKQYLERVRDVFLFCCFTSLRYSDVRNLKRSDIKPDHIEVTTVKTADSLIIELNDHSKAILEKYKDVHFENHMALPVISNQKMNDYLKELGELAEINEPVRETYYKGNERIDEVTPKYALLSTHAGRKTFICNALALGIPAPVVMKWTGHSDYKAMKPYIDIADDIRANAMNKFNQL